MLSAVVTLGLLGETDSACRPFMTSLRMILPLVANATTIVKSVRSLIQRQRFPLDIMLVCVRWYIAYALSLRNLEEMTQRARRVRRSFHDSPLGHQAGSGVGGSIPTTEAQTGYRRDRKELEIGRDVHQDPQRGSILVSCRG
jgi:hypothetical protein